MLINLCGVENEFFKKCLDQLITERRRGTRPRNEATRLNNPRVRMLEQRGARERVPSEDEKTKGEVRSDTKTMTHRDQGTRRTQLREKADTQAKSSKDTTRASRD